MSICVDHSHQSFLYTISVESLSLAPAVQAYFVGERVRCQWQVHGRAHRSGSFVLRAGRTPVDYVVFLAISFPDIDARSLPLRLALLSAAPGREPLAALCLDLAALSREESFQAHAVELKSRSGVLAAARLHSACQPRWAVDAAVVPRYDALFVDCRLDAQAEYIHRHIAHETDDDVAEGLRGRPAQSRRSTDSGSLDDRRAHLSDDAKKRGVLWHLARLFGCAQELSSMVSCAPKFSACSSRKGDDHELGLPEAPARQPRNEDMEEEPLDEVFRHPSLAAALAKHPQEGWEEAPPAAGHAEREGANDRLYGFAPPPGERDHAEGLCPGGWRPVLPL